jgi:CBS domain-containing protein
MRAKDIMTRDPQCCGREDTARRAAEVMRDYDCGVIPVIDESRRVIGVIAIVGRSAAELLKILPGMVPLGGSNGAPAFNGEGDDLRDVERKMAELQIRRIPIVDAGGRCLGIISQADIARAAGKGDNGVSEEEIALVVEQISEPAHRSRSRGPEGTSERKSEMTSEDQPVQQQF